MNVSIYNFVLDERMEMVDVLVSNAYLVEDIVFLFTLYFFGTLGVLITIGYLLSMSTHARRYRHTKYQKQIDVAWLKSVWALFLISYMIESRFEWTNSNLFVKHGYRSVEFQFILVFASLIFLYSMYCTAIDATRVHKRKFGHHPDAKFPRQFWREALFVGAASIELLIAATLYVFNSGQGVYDDVMKWSALAYGIVTFLAASSHILRACAEPHRMHIIPSISLAAFAIATTMNTVQWMVPTLQPDPTGLRLFDAFFESGVQGVRVVIELAIFVSGAAPMIDTGMHCMKLSSKKRYKLSSRRDER